MKTTSKLLLWGVWGTLLLLLLATWGLSRVNLGQFNAAVAVGISVVKMLLIVVYFMQARRGPQLLWVCFAAGWICWLIFVDLALSDYLTR